MAINLRSGLLRLLGVGILLAWCAAALADGHVTIPYFLAASEFEDMNEGRQGFLRLINHSDNDGMVTVTAIDNAGNETPFTVRLDARQTRHFNSDDLETNPRNRDFLVNADNMPFMGVGPPYLDDGTVGGHWRLRISADESIGNDKIEALEYVRARSGFLTTMHDSAREPPEMDGMRMYQVRTFNPGSNRTQRSSLYLINRADGAANVTVTGVDDAGMRGEMDVTFMLGGGKAAEIPSQALEGIATEDDWMGMMMPDDDLSGMLGDGDGKWQLFVTSDQPLHVLSLMKLPGGYISNLSTTTSAMDFGPPAAPAPPEPEPPAPGGEDTYAMMCEGIEVGPNEMTVSSGGNTVPVASCLAALFGPVDGSLASPVDGSRTNVHESKWQMRMDADSDWTDVPETTKTADICVYDPGSTAGQYRLVIDQTVTPRDGEPTRFKCSSNSFTVE